jgi:hypothetical protein
VAATGTLGTTAALTSIAFGLGLSIVPVAVETLLSKFDGEFASRSQTYAGTGTLRYTVVRFVASNVSDGG